jgi:putative nucleotidyltransferase with HDIG domain
MNDESPLVVDEDKIKKSVQSGLPLTITTYTLPHDMEIYIAQVLSAFLKYSGHEGLKDYIEYCVQELAVNAKKANTKRVYFLEKKLDLNNSEQYKEGMTNFKKDTLNNLAHYLKLQKDNGYYIKVVFIYKKESVVIEVRNNVAIAKQELMRIYDKIARSRQYNNLGDAFAQVLDDSEGAGLGLVVLVLMLKKMGLDEECFEILSSGTETVARLTIPFEQTKVSHISDITKAIVENVNGLPKFPENIISVQRLASDPKSEMKDIAKAISTDPSMTADIIKLVNSPLYMTSNKVDNIADAVTILGIKGIKNLFYSYGTQKLLGDDTEEKKTLWVHCYKAAFYAYNLVRNFGKDKSVLDDSYTCAILHDMGKIVFSKSVPDLATKMKGFCGEKKIPQVTLEDVSAGMNHAEIGALVAEKWNFPALIVTAIRFHHDPLAAPKQDRAIVDAVYLANMFCEIERGNAAFEQLEPSILTSFGFSAKKQVELVIQRLADGFLAETRKKSR